MKTIELLVRVTVKVPESVKTEDVYIMGIGSCSYGDADGTIEEKTQIVEYETIDTSDIES